ncbi:cell wall-active antibiotics response protein LiaF [Streptococcus merionis]|uniref:cell wall-active antibiotics response protein LiaF n=1 Tax=Streptococcus merionis TaxID=400065 RepID=UPI0026EAD6BF|nr:cell wall-active antibiotics response protein LiaF [Streptococcus merionis]
MKKIQLFLTVEAILLAMALLDIMSTDFPRFVLLLFLLILGIRFYLGNDSGNLLLTSAALLLFFTIMANPYVILAIILGVIYMMINSFSRMQKRENYQFIQIDQAPRRVKRERMQWFGNQDYFSESTVYPFDDVNIVRVFGNDVIDLTEVALAGMDNVILIRKTFGTTRIVVPVGVEVDLTTSAVYGHLEFLDLVGTDLRNESVKFQSHDFLNAQKKVKIVCNTLFGDIEVSRQ